jgi:hypothetical protein
METIDKLNIKNIVNEIGYVELKDKIESLQDIEVELPQVDLSELKEAIRKLNMDIDAMRGSFDVIEDKIKRIEDKFKRKF